MCLREFAAKRSVSAITAATSSSPCRIALQFFCIVGPRIRHSRCQTRLRDATTRRSVCPTRSPPQQSCRRQRKQLAGMDAGCTRALTRLRSKEKLLHHSVA